MNIKEWIGIIVIVLTLVVGVTQLIRQWKVLFSQNIFSEVSLKKWGIGFNLVFLALVSGLAWWALQNIRREVETEIRSILETVRLSTSESMLIWFESQSKILLDISQKKNLVEAAVQQMDRLESEKDLLNTPSLDSLRSIFNDYKDRLGHKGFFVIAPNGTSVGSSRDRNIGTKNLIYKHYPELVEKSLGGDFVLVPPIPSDVFLKGVSKIHGSDLSPTMFIMGPIYSQKEIVGVLTMRLDPSAELSRITNLGRMGKTGETYLVDKKGMMLTESRFLENLRSLGMLGIDEQSILSIAIKDPGINRTRGTIPRSQQVNDPYTVMAKSLMKKESSFNVKGYRDYRGIMVLGSWSWLDAFGLGIASEIDREEALKPYYYAKAIILVVLSITMAISILITMTLLSVARRGNLSLLKSQEELESKILDRTFHLMEAKEQIEEKEKQFRSLVSNIPGMIFRKNDRSLGRMDFVSDYIRVLSGYSAVELEKNNQVLYEGLIHSEDLANVREKMKNGLEAKGSYSLEYRLRHRDGSLRWVYEHGQALKSKSGNVMFIDGFVMDISEQKKMEEDLVIAKEQAINASLAKSYFLASMSHEIRTPLNGVIGMQALLMQSCLNKEQRQKLEIAISSAESLLPLLNDILDFSKIEANRLDIEEIDFNLISLLEEFSQMMAFRCDQKGIDLILDQTELEYEWVKGDPTRISQVLNNLVGNAIKFTEAGQVVIKVKVVDAGDSLELQGTIRDSGVGISQEKQKEIFNFYTQENTSTARSFGGTGLGLAICKKLCELMHGDLTMSSQKGDGTTFRFHFIVKKSTKEGCLPLVSLNGLEVSLVDQNEIRQNVYKAYLQTWGCQVKVFASAEELLEVLQKGSVGGVILTNRSLPNMDGFELCKTIRLNNEWNEIDLLICNSMIENVSADEYHQLGFSGYFYKPIPRIDLHRSLELIGLERSKTRTEKTFITQKLNLLKESNLEWKNFAYDFKDKHVLVVEDNEVNQVVIEEMLKELQVDCTIASSGQEAIEILENKRWLGFDMILMDCRMPGMDGMEVSRIIRSGSLKGDYEEIPIVALTANAMKGDEALCIAAGMNEYLSKPVRIEELVEKLDLFLNSERIPLKKNGENLFAVPENLKFFDFSNKRTYLAETPQIYFPTLQLFYKVLMKKKLVLAEALAEENANLILEAVHIIKGSAMNVSVLHIGKLGNKIELQIRERGEIPFENVVAFQELLLKIESECQQLMEANPEFLREF